MSGTPGNLENAIIQTQRDVENLECQIRNLLRSMDVVGHISNAQTLPLPKLENDKKDYTKPEVRMEWQATSDYQKSKKKSKTRPESKGVPNLEEKDLTALDVLDMCISESTNKYIAVDDSVFFVPILDRCVFGVTLRNATKIKLKKPTISLSLMQDADTGSSKKPCRCFLYDVHISLKEMNADDTILSKTTDGLSCQDSFSRYLNDDVMPGAEVLVSATFAYPNQFLLANENFSLVLSVYLQGKELWSREVPISNNYFLANHIDMIYKKHILSITSAISTQHQIFKIERLLSQSELSPHRLMQRFLEPLGYEQIESIRTGADTTIEMYSVHQPSLLWGTSFKIEKFSKRPSAIRCIVTSRRKEQMQLIFSQLKVWSDKEGRQERRLGLGGIKISPISTKNNLNVSERIQAEIDMIERLQQVKSLFRKRMYTQPTQRRIGSQRETGNSLDPCWIEEYSTKVESTDIIFLPRIKK